MTATRSTPIGDEELEALRRRFRAAVARACPGWLANDAEDIVQAGFMRLVEKLKNSAGEREFSSIYLAKAICLPSGDQDGVSSQASSGEICTDVPSSRSRIMRMDVVSSMMACASRFPSGDTEKGEKEGGSTGSGFRQFAHRISGSDRIPRSPGTVSILVQAGKP